MNFIVFSNGKRKSKSKEHTDQQIHSNPENCDDIGKLGYTLNGFYFVNDNVSAGRFVVVFCQFKLPPAGGGKSKGI